jgi:hypothetical protein
VSCGRCGTSANNSIHHRKTQYGYHEFVVPEEKEAEPSLYQRRLQYLRNRAEGGLGEEALRETLTELIEVLI